MPLTGGGTGAGPGSVEWACSYPFGIPDHSFVLRDGQVHPWAANGPDTAGRTPVIACGSNRSPVQLGRKFATAGGGAAVPVQRAWLDDFDVVYAAHITSYGSIAATLQHVPGARVEVSVTWLSDDQLPTMHKTEGRGFNYDYARLDGLSLALEHGAARDWAYAYVFRGGCLTDDGSLVALTEIRADNRQHPALSQPEAQIAVHGRTAGDVPHRDFIAQNIADPDLRRARERALQADAAPFGWSDVSVIHD